jgi:UDP-N-acetylmuramyl pentapeptide synthase
VDRIICVGDLARSYGAEAVEAGFPRSAVDYAASPEEVARLIDDTLREGDVVLFKGSRAIGLDRAVEILARPGREKRSEA